MTTTNADRCCVVCGAAVTGRGRTCSRSCSSRLGNRGRGSLARPCRHCDMCDDYRLQRWNEELAIENGGFRDEDWRSRIITFRYWLQHYTYEPLHADRAA